MAKKIIITEEQIKHLLNEGVEQAVDIDKIAKSDSLKREIKKQVGDYIKDDKELEQKIRKTILKALNNYMKIMWQRRGFYESDLFN